MVALCSSGRDVNRCFRVVFVELRPKSELCLLSKQRAPALSLELHNSSCSYVSSPTSLLGVLAKRTQQLRFEADTGESSNTMLLFYRDTRKATPTAK